MNNKIIGPTDCQKHNINMSLGDARHLSPYLIYSALSPPKTKMRMRWGSIFSSLEMVS